MEALYKNYRKNQGYDLVAEDWSAAYAWYLRGWLPEDHSAPLLEIGCGEGHLLAALKKWGYDNATGVDIREEAVAYCASRNLAAVCADAVDYLLKNAAAFDVVIAIDLVEHLSKNDALRLLFQISKSLRPGGALIVQVPNLASPFGSEIFFGDLTHQTGFSPDGLGQLLRSAGFLDVELRETGPGLWSVKSAVRFALWRGLVLFIRLWNVIECGGRARQPVTRVMLAKAISAP